MFSNEVMQNMSRGSFIRAMFTEGEKLKSKLGAENVFDFSIGNPYIEPPEELTEYMVQILKSGRGIHRYMDNAGFKDVRETVADALNADGESNLTYENVVMTVGAAGGLNVVLKALLNPGEEVVVFAPYFVEYLFYIENYGGTAVVSPPNPETLQPDTKKLENLITSKTKAIIINNPNNPTGIVYGKKTLSDIRDAIIRKESEFGTDIYVISDQPYADIVYGGVKLENIMSIFKNAIIVNSYSKSLGLAGERIGYIAVSEKLKGSGELIQALTFCNRTLGFVNAPALFQMAAARAVETGIGICMSEYETARDFLFDNLTGIGYDVIKPDGAFYMFPKSPLQDDVAFARLAVKHGILVVPGRGFGVEGYFRISYCVNPDTIKRSIRAFEKLMIEACENK